MEFFVSKASIARWLVQINVPEPEARKILARVRQAIIEHPAPEWGGQMIALSRAVAVLGEHGAGYRAWIACERSLPDRSQMVDDWQTGRCVTLTETLAGFLRQQDVHTKSADAILDTVAANVVAGVITVPRWSWMIPEDLMPAWLEWNEIPHAAVDIQDIQHAEVAQ